ncbi:MAG: SPASM domain-containing protein [Prevotellaceae bacterium]|jgi:uncharacterized protein|nr:SPASM domain-containing protein [Prevotellaceae bacterium]
MKLRKSSYTISVKIENERDKYMLIHGYTGAIDIVNFTVDKYLETGVDFSEDIVPFSKSTLDMLLNRGYLTTKDREEERQHVIKLASLLHKTKKIMHKSFVFMVAYDCNFRCPYCYESKVLKNSRQWSRRVFSKEMVDKAYNSIFMIEPEHRLRPNVILLYGGEPLLKDNKDIVEYIVNKGKDLGFRFTAVTNGYDLAEYEHLLSPECIFMLQVTLDGTEEMHNRRRIHHSGEKTFQKILDNISLALDRGVNISLRINTDGNNFYDLDGLYLLFKELGFFEKRGKFNPYSAKLFDYSQNEDVTDNSKGNRKLNYLNEREFNLLHKKEKYKYNCNLSDKAQMIKDSILKKKRLTFSPVYCSAQIGSYILDPFGEIYGCWNEIGVKDKVIGHYFDEEINWTDYKNHWHSQNIGTSFQCSICKYAFICHGGCISHNELRKGILEPGYCNDFSETIKNAVNLAYNYLKQERDN